MGYGKRTFLFLVVVAMCFLLEGCVTTKEGAKEGAYEKGYRTGARENMGELVEKMNGNSFPYIAGTWAQPLVQEVRIPAHVAGGVFYPEHDELVLITPGEWEKSGAFPLSTKKGHHGGEEAVIRSVMIPGKDITVRPLTTESFQRGEE